MFLLHGVLLIPKVAVQPNLDEVQDALVSAGRMITSVSKGVGQWSGGKTTKVTFVRNRIVNKRLCDSLSNGNDAAPRLDRGRCGKNPRTETNM